MFKDCVSNTIDFLAVFSVDGANPNGDPLNGNYPRINSSGFGAVSSQCIKRKIRDRLMDRYLILSEEDRTGNNIFVQADYNRLDEFSSLSTRYNNFIKRNNLKKASASDIRNKACLEYYDVRTFGQVFAFSGDCKESGVSIGVRGPVTIRDALSLEEIEVDHMQITKSVNGKEMKEGAKAPDTMGSKYVVNNSIYVLKGSINASLASLTGFSDKDVEVFKDILPIIFYNDESSTRPAGSMTMMHAVWCYHGGISRKVNTPSKKVHDSIVVNNDGTLSINKIDGIDYKVFSI